MIFVYLYTYFIYSFVKNVTYYINIVIHVFWEYICVCVCVCVCRTRTRVRVCKILKLKNYRFICCFYWLLYCNILQKAHDERYWLWKTVQRSWVSLFFPNLSLRNIEKYVKKCVEKNKWKNVCIQNTRESNFSAYRKRRFTHNLKPNIFKNVFSSANIIY